MNRPPQPASRLVELARGASALAPGLLWLGVSRVLVAADIHLGYEDVIGGALPAWSTAEIVATLSVAARSMRAREIVLLGDVIHGTRMSEGAARTVRRALDALRDAAALTIVAGNHEGKSRGAAILGETCESVTRDGWLLVHGDKPPDPFEFAAAAGVAIGHLHPSLALGAGASAPAFLAGDRIVAVPALTPYSGGLDVCSTACFDALRPFGVTTRADLHVVVATNELCYPFGALADLPAVLARRPPAGKHRKMLRPDR